MDLAVLGLEVILSIVAIYLLIFKVFGLRVIGNDKLGVIERWWSRGGSLKEGIIALNDEAGFLPDVLRGGIHFKPGFIYKVHTLPLISIPQEQIGYVFSRSGAILENSQKLGKIIPESNIFQDVRGFLTNGGQKGPQRGVLRGGTHAINLAQFVVITKDNIFYLPLGNNASERESFDEIQRKIMSENGFEPIVIRGTESVKSSKTPEARFDEASEVKETKTAAYNRDVIGVVTVHDGPSLPSGEIISPIVGDDIKGTYYHNNFQDAEEFLQAGGTKGRQLQVLTDGTYYINRLFATVEYVPKTTIPVGFVGVVVSYTGKVGLDETGDGYKHGELVPNGCKGVWVEPLLPGKYAFNTYAGEIKLVPTTNIILKWINDEAGMHKLDANLKEIELITKDAFQPSLPLSVVLHIQYKLAPRVIQRFGDMERLVNQTLDPLIASYFKNVGQVKTLVELLQDRSEIQKLSTEEMHGKFSHYNIELEEVLIGTPQASKKDTQMDNVLEQLRQRQVAKEQVATFESQRIAADKKKSLKEAEAIAEQQSDLTASEINIKVEANRGEAEAKKAEQDALKIRTIAGAKAEEIRLIGIAEADKIAKIGEAEASAIDAQVKAYGGPQYQLTEKVMTKFSDSIAIAKIPFVPTTVVNMGGANGEANPNVFENFVKLMTLANLGVDVKGMPEETKSIKEPLTEDSFKVS